MAIIKGLLKRVSKYQDGIYPYTQTDCVFDENGNALDGILTNINNTKQNNLIAGTGINITGNTISNTNPTPLTAGTGIDISNNVITNKFVSLSSGTNLDNVNYEYSGYVLSPTNAPTSSNGHLASMGWNTAGTYGYQLWAIYNTNVLYFRKCINSSWSSWEKLVFASEVETAIMDTLYTRTSTSAYSDTTLSISNLSSYKYIIFAYRISNSSNSAIQTMTMPYNTTDTYQVSYYSATNTKLYSRMVKMSSTGVTTSQGTDTNYLVPYKIYGVK